MPVGIIIAIFLWITGILIFISDYSKAKRCTGETTAVITDVAKEEHWRHRSHGSGRETYYYPIIEFAVRDKSYRVKTNIKATCSETFIKGDRLKIQYNPENPYDLKLHENSLRDGLIGMGIMFLLGTVIFCISIRAYP